MVGCAYLHRFCHPLLYGEQCFFGEGVRCFTGPTHHVPRPWPQSSAANYNPPSDDEADLGELKEEKMRDRPADSDSDDLGAALIPWGGEGGGKARKKKKHKHI